MESRFCEEGREGGETGWRREKEERGREGRREKNRGEKEEEPFRSLWMMPCS